MAIPSPKDVVNAGCFDEQASLLLVSVSKDLMCIVKLTKSNMQRASNVGCNDRLEEMNRVEEYEILLSLLTGLLGSGILRFRIARRGSVAVVY